MRIKFFCNSGANIHSCREEVLDTVEDLGLDPGEWEAMSDDDKYKEAQAWASQRLEIGWEEVESDAE